MTRRPRRTACRAVPLLGLTLALTAGCGFLGGPNPAEQEAHSLEGTLRVHPSRLCDNGDPGRGPDNTVPWYDDYLTVADSPALVGDLTTAARAKGFALADDRAEARKNTNALSPYSPSNVYLSGRHDGRLLRVTVFRHSTAVLACSKGWGRKVTPYDGQAVVQLSLTLPDTH